MARQSSVYPVDVEVQIGVQTTPIVKDNSILLNTIQITKELLNGSSGLFRVYFELVTSTGGDYELVLNRKREGLERGINAAGTATISNGKVNGVLMTNTGDGYPIGLNPLAETIIVFINTGTGGTGADGTLIIRRGQIVGVTITNPGSGYTKPPLVLFVSSNTPAAGADLKFNADNNFILKSGGYYRFDAGVRVGDIIDFIYKSQEATPPTIIDIQEFRIDQIQIGA